MIRFAVFVLFLAACSSAKEEASSLVAAVDRFHRAENVDKPARAATLAGVACTDPAVCEAKAACLTATKATADALTLKGEVEARLADVRRGALPKTDDAVKTLRDKLDEAGRLLEQGRKDMPACNQQILVLRGRYDL